MNNMESTEQIKCYCGREVTTHLKCGGQNCENYICPKCMIQTKTVPKCKNCAKLQINPAFNPSIRELLMSFLVCNIFSVLYSYSFNIILILASPFISRSLSFYVIILPIPILGWIISFIIEKTSRYKKSNYLQLIAAFSVLVGHTIIWSEFQISLIPWLLSLAIGIYLSILKVRI